MKYKIKLKGTNPRFIGGKKMLPGEVAIIDSKLTDRSNVRIEILESVPNKKLIKKEDKNNGFMESEGSDNNYR